MMVSHLPVLDKGFVTLIDRMGDDHAVAEAARVSYKSEAKTPEDDRKLIAYLWAHKHTTPFEHTAFKFHVKAPIFVARQWFRHRMASYNETSFRYREAPAEFYVPTKWRAQDSKNKQGSIGGVSTDDGIRATTYLKGQMESAFFAYNAMIESGISKEMARMVLPVNLYTEFYWTLNAHALMHFIRLRSEAHAQWEIKQYSNAIWHLWAPLMPWTAEAFLSTIDVIKYRANEGEIPGPNIESLRQEKASAI